MKSITLTAIMMMIFGSLFSCTSENRENPRVYVEGKMADNTTHLTTLTVKVLSDKKVVAETIPTGSGNFVLSGPLLSETFSVQFNRKIKSFNATKADCRLSEDSLVIIAPASTTYLKFNEIILK